MTPTDRLLSILLALQARRWQRGEDLAAMLDVSLRTVYRDMQALANTGVPLVAVPGKGYSLDEGYFMPPLMFTADEAVMLLQGREDVVPPFGERYAAAARTAARKIESVLPPALLEEAAVLQESLRFVPLNIFDHPDAQARLQQLRRALIEQRTVRFGYDDAQDGAAGDGSAPAAAPRRVNPYGLVERGGAWYLVGYSHLRRDVRHYRLDRMADLQLEEATFERPPGYRLGKQAAAAPREVTVRVRFEGAAARWVREAPPAFAVEQEDVGAALHLTLRVQREAEVLPWLLGWGGHACVLEPASLRRRLAEEAARIVARYEGEKLLLS